MRGTQNILPQFDNVSPLPPPNYGKWSFSRWQNNTKRPKVTAWTYLRPSVKEKPGPKTGGYFFQGPSTEWHRILGPLMSRKPLSILGMGHFRLFRGARKSAVSKSNCSRLLVYILLMKPENKGLKLVAYGWSIHRKKKKS